jgi:hypothetical protein
MGSGARVSGAEKPRVDLGTMVIENLDVDDDVANWRPDEYHAKARALVDALTAQAADALRERLTELVAAQAADALRERLTELVAAQAADALRERLTELVASKWSEAHGGAPVPPALMH